MRVEGEVNQSSDGRLRIVTRSWQVSLLVSVTNRRLGICKVLKTVGRRSEAREKEEEEVMAVVDVVLRG